MDLRKKNSFALLLPDRKIYYDISTCEFIIVAKRKGVENACVIHSYKTWMFKINIIYSLCPPGTNDLIINFLSLLSLFISVNFYLIAPIDVVIVIITIVKHALSVNWYENTTSNSSVILYFYNTLYYDCISY